MFFKCFKAIAAVHLEAENLIWSIKTRLSHTSNNKRIDKHLKKLTQVFRPVACRIGPVSMKPFSVGNSMMILLNYYIMAVLW